MSIRVGTASKRAHTDGHSLDVSGIVRDRVDGLSFCFAPRNTIGGTLPRVVSGGWIGGCWATSLLILSLHPPQSVHMCGCSLDSIFHVAFSFLDLVLRFCFVRPLLFSVSGSRVIFLLGPF